MLVSSMVSWRRCGPWGPYAAYEIKRSDLVHDVTPHHLPMYYYCVHIVQEHSKTPVIPEPEVFHRHK